MEFPEGWSGPSSPSRAEFPLHGAVLAAVWVPNIHGGVGSKRPLCQIQLGVVLKPDQDPLGPEEDAGGAVHGDVQGAVGEPRVAPGCSFPLPSPAPAVAGSLGDHTRDFCQKMLFQEAPEYLRLRKQRDTRLLSLPTTGMAPYRTSQRRKCSHQLKSS